MNISFAHNGVSHGITYNGTRAGNAKFYRVPKEYSEDGYYISSWEDGAIEPVPACGQKEALLLCQVRIENAENGSKFVKIIKTTDGATCHAEN